MSCCKGVGLNFYRSRKCLKPMVTGDNYNVPVCIHNIRTQGLRKHRGVK